MATHPRTELVLEALNMATWQRRPKQVIRHSDQGTQYTSIAFGLRCKELGVRPSMGSVGDSYDNAMWESFFATLECDLLDRNRFTTQAEVRMAVFDFIEGFYNPRRRYSALGQISPINFERPHGIAAQAGRPLLPRLAWKAPLSPGWGGSVNLSVHPSTKAGRLHGSRRLALAGRVPAPRE